MTRAAEQCREWIEAEFDGTPIGRFACRDTASGGISQHSAYKGYDSNALDIYGPGKGTSPADQLWIQRIVDTIVADGEAKWSIRKILWLQKNHYNHAHIDFYPMITNHMWCGKSWTPTWKYERGHSPSTITTRDPLPQNGLYNGSGSQPIDPPDIPIPPPDEEADEMEEYVKAQQINLNAAGFTDYQGKKLVVDGVPGRRTYSAQAKRDVAAADSGGSPEQHKHNFNGVTGVPI